MTPTARFLRALIASLVVIHAGASFAQTCNTVLDAGTVSGAVFTLDQSPVCLNGDIVVNQAEFRAGVQVQALGNHAIRVAGILTAVGTPTMPVRFFSAAENPAGWQGIRFETSLPGSVLAHFEISDSVNGAITVINSAPVIRDCLISNNRRINSGGGGIATDSPLSVSRCTFLDNLVVASAGPGGNARSYGGGIFASAALSVSESRFLGNRASASGGGSGSRGTAQGGAIWASDALTLTRSSVDSNVASASASGSGNSGGYARGGGIHATGDTLIVNTEITRNLVGGNREALGGGMFASGGPSIPVVLRHVTLADNNQATIFNADAALQIVNSIIWPGFISIAGESEVLFSNIQGGAPGEGNIDLNPLYLIPDPASSDYSVRLDPFSPMKNAGTANIAELPSVDIDGTPRPSDAGFDIGADEIASTVGDLPNLSAAVQSFVSLDFGRVLIMRVVVTGSDVTSNAFDVEFLIDDGATSSILKAVHVENGLAPGETSTQRLFEVGTGSYSGQTLTVLVRHDGPEPTILDNRVEIVIP